jgi:hypothetical protein
MKDSTRNMIQSPWSLIAAAAVLAVITEVIRKMLFVG